MGGRVPPGPPYNLGTASNNRICALNYVIFLTFQRFRWLEGDLHSDLSKLEFETLPLLSGQLPVKTTINVGVKTKES